MNIFYRYSLFFILGLTCLLTIDFVSKGRILGNKLYLVESHIAALSRPVGWSFRTVFQTFGNVYRNYFELVDIKRKYFELQQENAKLKAELYISNNIAQENQRLHTILNFKEQNGFDLVIGKIIGHDPSFTFKNIQINLGQKDGIQPGMGVLSPIGAIGTVVRVRSRTCDVLLITDPNSNLDALITRNQSRGILQGKYLTKMRFKYFDTNTNILVGDKIVTSGLTGAFPANIPIGTVTKVNMNKDDLSQIVDVESAVDFLNLTEVVVLKKNDPEMEIIREIAGDNWIESLMNSGSGKKDE